MSSQRFDDTIEVMTPEELERHRSDPQNQIVELKAKLLDIANGCCVYSGPGRGDCEHFVGLPGKSIPGVHDGDDDTVDVYGKPNGWCAPCWRAYQLEHGRDCDVHKLAR